MSDQKSYGFIYESTNEVNGMKYIGQRTRDESSSYLGSGIEITKAIQEFGRDNFSRVILERCQTPMELYLAEIQWINDRDAVRSSEYYNRISGGGIISEGTKKKLSDSQTGMKRSEETKRKICDAKKNEIQSGEHRRKNSDAHI